MNKPSFESFNQIGIVVRNIEKSVPFLENLFNFKVKLNIIEQDTTVFYKGKEVNFQLKKVMPFLNKIQLEMVEVVKSNGDHLYLDFLKQGKEGLHHLGIYVKNAEDLIKYYKKEFNIDMIQSGSLGKKVNFYYLDTEEILGYYIELIEF
jgi:catechol 2,3-dioxygenase-like lactoylglutathione lyase family enzyme